MHIYSILSSNKLQEGYETPSLGMSQRAYFIAESLRQTSLALFALCIGIVFYLVIGTFQAYFFPYDIDFFKFWLPFTIIVLSGYLIWYYLKTKQTYRKLKSWNEDYFEQSYFLIFDTMIPTGNTSGEKVLSLAKLIFPELRSDYVELSLFFPDHIIHYFKRKFGKSEEQHISKSLNYVVGSYSFDLALNTMEGYFIVKDFKDKVVTVDDLRQLVHVIRGKFKDKYRREDVLRVICIANEYDKPFLQRESLEDTMTKEINTNFKIDLLIEEKVGYSVMWVA